MLVVLVCVGTILQVALGVEGTTCEGYDCGVGRECFLQEVPCYQGPCPVFPACRLSCDVVICKEGFICEEGQCVEDLCYEVKCRPEFLCVEGQCILKPTCDGVYCGCGQECYLQEVQCVKAPCFPIPTCREIDKCASVECECGTTCVDGECVQLTCDGHECESGEECYLEELDCGCKMPNCRPIDKCASIRCRKGFYCDNGQCIANPTCKGVRCGPYEECYLQEIQCYVPPCPPEPTCRPVDRCAYTRCKSGYYCDDGQCLPNPSCDGVYCKPNQECYLEEVVCVRSPCPPLPSCRPLEGCGDKCDSIICKSGYYCDDGQCLPNPSCDGVYCGPNEECYLEEAVCVCPPCPPIPSCRPIVGCGDKCDSIVCLEGYYCDEGQCYPYPSCDGVYCGPGAECYLEEVVCVKEPCLPIPSCRPVQSCASITCVSGTFCIRDECYPATCDRFPCDPEEECYMRELPCFFDPCPPPVPTCRLSCDYIFCTADSICVDGQCIRICV